MKNYFPDNELQCPCCGKLNFSKDTKLKLNLARALAGIPFILNSACRCKAHNTEVGGKENSSHLCEGQECTAVDIKATTSRQRYLILAALIGAGFNRIGIAKTFVHADADPTKDEKVIWLYT